MKNFNLKLVLESYLEALLWADEELDGYSICDIDNSLIESSKKDIEEFINIIENTDGAMEEAETYSETDFGHNFLLSRNGHGAGFFDENNDILQNICREMKSVDAYVGDDNKIYY